MMSIDQIAIPILGVSAVYMTQSTNALARRCACIVGICSQPFWFYASFHAHQWGIFAASCMYTLSWAKGIYNNWYWRRTHG